MRSRVMFLALAAGLAVAIFLVSEAVQPGHAGPFTREAAAAPNNVQNARKLLQQGDGFRARKDWDKAKRCYDAALKLFQSSNAQKFIMVTQAIIEVCDEMPALSLTKMKDGTYQGSSMGYVTDITVEVTVKSGKISSFRIVSHKENRALKSLETVPQQIVSRKTPSVDAYSGATITSYAVMNATMKALKQAQPPPKDDAKKKGD